MRQPVNPGLHGKWPLKRCVCVCVLLVVRSLCNAVPTIGIRLRFDGRSTAVRLRSLRSRRHSTSVPADTLAAVTLTYLFIYLGRRHDECRRAVVARRTAVESKFIRSCNRRLRRVSCD